MCGGQYEASSFRIQSTENHEYRVQVSPGYKTLSACHFEAPDDVQSSGYIGRSAAFRRTPYATYTAARPGICHARIASVIMLTPGLVPVMTSGHATCPSIPNP